MSINVNINILSQIAFLFLIPLNAVLGYLHLRGFILAPHAAKFGLLFVFCLFFINFNKIQKNNYRIYIWINYLLVLFIFITIGLVIVFDNSTYIDDDERVFLIFNSKVLILYLAYYIVGLNLNIKKNGYFILTYMIFAMLVVSNVDFNTYSISFDGFQPGMHDFYLFMADAYAVTTILILSYFNSSFRTMIIIIISVIILIFLNSRSSLYVFIFVSLLILFNRRNKFTYWCFFVTLILTIVGLWQKFYVFEFLSHKINRMLAIFDLDNDLSWQLRNEQLQNGINAIKNNMVFGDYLGQVRDFNNIGNYMHNYLSLYRQYGVFVFFSFIILIGNYIYISVKYYLSKNRIETNKAETFFFIYAGLYSMVQIIVARSYTDPLIWIFIGLSHKILIDNRIGKMYRKMLIQ